MNRNGIYPKIWLYFFCWILLTIWMVALGYGSDGDAWSVANAANQIWQSKSYVASRTTGFPLYEISVAPFVYFGGWYFSNLFTFLFGLSLLTGLIYLARNVKTLNNPDLVFLCFAFNPYIIANSTSTMDYIPALSFIIWAYVLLQKRNPMLAAVFVGIAAGFRPTSGLFIIPICVLLYTQNRNVSQVFKVFLLALIVGTIAYSPALLSYGIPDVFGSVKLSLKSRVLIGGYNALQLVGILQSVVVYPVLIYFLVRDARAKGFNPLYRFHVINILVWGILFVLLPNETAYLLPLLPSVVLLLDSLINRKAFILITALLLSFNFIQIDALGGESGQRTIDVSLQSGKTVMDVQDRLFKISTRQAATHYIAHEPTVLMYGKSWIPTLNEEWEYDHDFEMYRQKEGKLYVSGRIRDEERLKFLKNSGFRVVVWEGEKWEYYYTNTEDLFIYIEVVEDLSDFFGIKLNGKAINQR